MMRKIACLLALAPALASADDTAPHKIFGVDGIAVVPMGDYANAAHFAGGGLARLELPVGPAYITARSGVIANAMTNDVGMTSLTFVPVYGGVRYPIGGGGYLAGELGITFMFGSAQTGFGTASASDQKLGLTLAGGYRAGALDIRAGLFAPDVANAVGLMASAGYDFALF
jgi:hypothetical protein